MSSLDTTPEARSVLLVVLAVDATRISDWTAGALSDRLTRVLAELRTHHLTVSAVLWQQGEADAQAGTGREAYGAAMTRLIRRLRDDGVNSIMLLAKSTRCRNAGSPEVREALTQVTQHEPGVYVGPDTDELGEDLRSDGCHLNSEGLQRAANGWAEALGQRGIVNLH